MNDEDAQWGDEFDAYVQAYVDEELEDDEAASAYARFEAERERLPRISPRLGRTAVMAAVGTALAAGLLGLWMWSGDPLEVDDADASGGLAPDVVDTHPDERRATPVELPPRAVTRRAPAPEAVEPAAVEPEPEAVQPPIVRTPKPRVPTKEPEVSSLAQELESVRALRQAARSGDYAQALSLARAHRKNFEQPTLAAERDLIEIEALCGLGRIAEAAEARDAFATAHAQHHLRVKAEGMCKKAPEPAQNLGGLRHQGE